MDKTPAPSLLPIFRSQQQAELLALILGDPSTERTLAELAERTGVPYASVHREVERAKASGLVTSRLVGRTRLIRANQASPYFSGLSDVLVRHSVFHGYSGMRSPASTGSTLPTSMGRGPRDSPARRAIDR